MIRELNNPFVNNLRYDARFDGFIAFDVYCGGIGDVPSMRCTLFFRISMFDKFVNHNELYDGLSTCKAPKYASNHMFKYFRSLFFQLFRAKKKCTRRKVSCPPIFRYFCKYENTNNENLYHHELKIPTNSKEKRNLKYIITHFNQSATKGTTVCDAISEDRSE